MKNRMQNLRLLLKPCIAACLLASGVRAELISVDFNTFALRGDEAEMQGADETFGAGASWNPVEIPRENEGRVSASGLKNSEGNPTSVSLEITGPKISSWWSTKRVMPESKLYRDYVGINEPATLTIKGLPADTELHLAVFGYPLGWGQVELSLNGQSIHVLSGPEWNDRQQPAGVMTVRTDAAGTLSGTVKGMWSGFHLSTDALVLQKDQVTLIVGEPEKEKPPEFPPSKSVVYKTVEGVDFHLDIYLPEGHQATDARPAIVFFHGGSWSGGWKTYFSPQCHYLASRGMVAITAAYRVTDRPPKSTPADCVRDAKSAIRWVRTHAAELGVDPDKIAAGGGSAGGHLAAATAYLSAYTEEGEDASVSYRPNALVLFNPVIDNSPGGGYPYGPQPMTENWPRWSPMHNITPETAVPSIFFLGDQDHLIPVSIGEEYIRRTMEAGADGEFYAYPGGKHRFYVGGEALRSTLQRMDDFLVKHGFLQAP